MTRCAGNFIEYYLKRVRGVPRYGYLGIFELKNRRRQWQATPVLLPRKSHGWRSLVGCSPWGRYKSHETEQLHFHFSLSHNGEGNGNPLQCSRLENPRDSRAWWATVYGVTQSRTRLKRLSSSSSSCKELLTLNIQDSDMARMCS